MLRGLQIVTVATLVWGSLAFASAPKESISYDLQTISSWMAHLNYYYPGLHVTPVDRTQLQDPHVRKQLMEDLGTLEELLGRGQSLPDSSLKQIACGRPECTGGGGGGKCSSCKVDKG